MNAKAKKFLMVETEGEKLTFVLGNGLRVEVAAGQLSADIKQKAMLHGLNQKVRDSAAGFSKDGDFSGAFRAMQQVVDNLIGGLWNAKGGSGTGDLVQAVANLKGIEVGVAEEIVGGLDDEQLKALLAKPKIKAEVARIKAERAQKVAEASDEDDLGI